MQMTLLVHILAGTLGLVAGVVALSAVKGGQVHRKSGMLFVYVMLTMALTGAVMAALTSVAGSVIAGLLTAYLVFTALTTVRTKSTTSRWLDVGPMLFGFIVGLASVTIGLATIADGKFIRDGIPVPMFFFFGTIALVASVADVRMIRSGRLTGARRLARHLWRMCFALFVASASFFLGQADKIPEPLRIMPLLAVLALAPLGVLFYWLWRVRFKRSWRGILTPPP